MPEHDDDVFQYQLALQLSANRPLGCTEYPETGDFCCNSQLYMHAIDLLHLDEEQQTMPTRPVKAEAARNEPSGDGEMPSITIVDDSGVQLDPLDYQLNSNRRFHAGFSKPTVTRGALMRNAEQFLRNMNNAGTALNSIGYLHLGPCDHPDFWNYEAQMVKAQLDDFKHHGVPSFNPMKFDISSSTQLATMRLASGDDMTVYVDTNNMVLTLYSQQTERALQLRAEHMVALASLRGVFNVLLPSLNVLVPPMPVKARELPDDDEDPFEQIPD